MPTRTLTAQQAGPIVIDATLLASAGTVTARTERTCKQAQLVIGLRRGGIRPGRRPPLPLRCRRGSHAVRRRHSPRHRPCRRPLTPARSARPASQLDGR